MDKIFSWLFGETKWQQRNKLKKMLIITAIIAVLALLMLFEGPNGTAIMAVIIALIWGWVFVQAVAGAVSNMIEISNSDVAITIISVILLLFVGVIGGGISLILGVIRFIQLENE